MKTIVAGSRNCTDVEIVRRAMNTCPFKITEVVSGCARGVDTIGEQLAERKGVPVKRFPANWDRDGKSAGYLRNAEMAEYAEALVAVWDGQSRGTKHMIDLAKRKGLMVYIFKA